MSWWKPATIGRRFRQLLLVVPNLVLVSCGFELTSQVGDSGEPWPAEIGVMSASGLSSSAFGWQVCELDTRLTELWRSEVGVYDPEAGVGANVSWFPRSGTAGDLRNHETWPSDGSDEQWVKGRALDQMRSVNGIRSFFTFDAEVDDPVLGSEVPVVAELDGGPSGAILRVEGIPQGWPIGALLHNQVQDRVYAQPGGVADAALSVLGSTGPTAPWLLDVWTDADQSGRVVGVRFQTQEMERTWRELRFVPVDEVLDGDKLHKPSCPDDFDSDVAGPWTGPERWEATMSTPLEVMVDADGRPYELHPYDPETTTSRSSEATLVAPGGQLLVIDGIAGPSTTTGWSDPVLTVTPDFVTDDDVHTVNVDVIWEHSRGNASVLGVWLGPSDAPVAQWDPFETAYVTDGGTGGVMSASLLDSLDNLVIDEDLVLFDGWFNSIDLDDVPGTDMFLFSNGWGDGGFPLSRGRDRSGEVVAAVIWRLDVPWRMAFPDAIPPLDVVEREEQLIECLMGVRLVAADGQCQFDPSD